MQAPTSVNGLCERLGMEPDEIESLLMQSGDLVGVGTDD